MLLILIRTFTGFNIQRIPPLLSAIALVEGSSSCAQFGTAHKATRLPSKTPPSGRLPRLGSSLRGFTASQIFSAKSARAESETSPGSAA